MMPFLGIETQCNIPMEDKNQEDKAIPSSARPHRNRKAVHRYPIEDLPSRAARTKIVVFQGNGTPLRDIPNVAFNLSKRKTDNNLVLLHIMLFGKKGKLQMVKKNLGLFSGFLWVEEEEKQRSKVRKKLDQCVKAKLLDFCDILDIPVNKATVKKEDLSAMLLKFLESPHPTTETLLANKVKTRKLKQNSQVEDKEQQSKVEEDDKKSESSIYEDYPQEDTDDEKENDSGDGEDEKSPHLGKMTAVKNIYLKECGDSKTQVKGHSESTKPTSRKRSFCSSSKDGTSEVATESKASAVKKAKTEIKSSVKKVNVTKEQNKGQSASVKKPKTENMCNKISEADTKFKSSVKKVNVGKEQNKGQNSSVKKPKTENKRNKITVADTEIKSSVKKVNVRKEQNKGQNASVKKPKTENKRNKISEADTVTKSAVKKVNVGKEQNKGQKASVRKPSSKLNTSAGSPAKANIIAQGKIRKKEAEVTGEEMQTVLGHILKKVDLNTATFADIRGQLGAHFNMDLSHRKAEVKALITDIINKMMDEDEEPNTGKDIDNEDDNDTYYN